MCGIAGITMAAAGKGVRKVADMIGEIRHRGPDDEGYVAIFPATGEASVMTGEGTLPALKGRFGRAGECDGTGEAVVLGQARLSIIDLSENGHQPMTNEDGMIWLTYNGEIYNYIELMDELKGFGHVFRSRTDSEVILHAYEQWGTGCLDRFNGMFAFGLWDQRRQMLFCARDPFGIKPFYYCRKGSGLAFASEIKSLLRLLPGEKKVNEDAMLRYLSLGQRNVSADTFFTGIRQLEPGNYLVQQAGDLTVLPYWDLSETRNGTVPQEKAVKDFTEGFDRAVARHLRSDVDVGFCLSGGLDSSSIVAAAYGMRTGGNTGNPGSFHTFSSCFDDSRFDEREYISDLLADREVTAHYIFPSPEILADDLERLVWHQDEPFGSLSIFAQWCVMKRAREEGIKVLLDGQGGDELLAGYPRFYLPHLVDTLVNGRFISLGGEFIHGTRMLGVTAGVLAKDMVRSLLPHGLVRKLRSRKAGTGRFPWIAGEVPDYGLERLTGAPDFSERVRQLSYLELRKFHLQELLHYEDRNSMAFGIESRVPFLDREFAEMVFRLPGGMKIGNGITKKIMRSCFAGRLPASITGRKDKMGFVTPGEQQWLNGPLRGWTGDMLAAESFRTRGWWDPDEIRRRVQAGTGTFEIWRCLNAELWFRHFIDA